jgi:tripartite-type tricarboxylate transporter receptor subunit TctC
MLQTTITELDHRSIELTDHTQLADQLTQQLGAAVLVENKTGGGAVIGIDAVAKAAPDGYTLLVTTTGTVMQNRLLYTKLPYNLDKDLVPITVFPSGPLVVGAAPNVPARNLKEFLAWAKGRDASMGSYAQGSYPQMLAIGVTGTYRTPRLPDVATLIEQGLNEPLAALEGGLVLMAPAGTPEAILQKLSAVVVKGAATEQAAKLRDNFGIPTKPKGLAETRADWERAVPAWIKAAVDLGVKLD